MQAAPLDLDATHTLRIAGMTCASCVATIEKALRATPGVHSAVVNLATGKAQVHAAAEVTTDVLAAAVKASGYSVRDAPAPGDEQRFDRAETRRLIIVAALTLPLVAVAMGPHILMLFQGDSGMSGMEGMEGMEGMTDEEMAAMGMDMGDEMDMTPYPWLQFTLATPVVLWGGAPFFRGAWRAFRARHLTMDVLVGTGMATAYGYSTAILLFPAFDSGQGVYFETAAVIVMLLLLGRRIEQGAQRRARQTLRRLLEQDENAGRLLENAQSSKIPIQQAVDSVVRNFVPIVLAIAVAASIFWMTLGAGIATDAGFTPSSMALMSLIAVLIIACPCALGLAVPMAVLTGTSRGAEGGIILGGGEALQSTRGLDTIVIKKTGILTTGNLEVADIVPIGRTADDLIALAAAAEGKSRHGIAIALQRRAHGHNLAEAEDFEDVPGQGVNAVIQGRRIRVGNPKWLAGEGVQFGDQQDVLERLRGEGKTVIGVAEDGAAAGLIALNDPARAHNARAVETLQRRGLQVVLLTGDHTQTAQAIAKPLGITRILAEVSAGDQAEAIRHLRGEGRRVAVLADAGNDSAVLAEAHLPITLGPAGSETGGIALLGDDLLAAPAALDLADATMRKVRQNLAWAFGYNAILIPVAAGLLVAWPLFGDATRLDPMLAGVAMTLSITSVMLNSLLLRRWQPSIRTPASKAHRGAFRLEAAIRLRPDG